MAIGPFYLINILKYITTRNVITSAEHGLTDLLNIEWQYHSLKGTHDDDDTLQVLEGTPNYPEILTISNNRTDNHRQVFNELGIYRKLPGVLEWEDLFGRRSMVRGRYISYDESRYWGIGSNYNNSKSGIASYGVPGLLEVPKTDWEYWGLDEDGEQKWVPDETLTVTEVAPLYPASIIIVDLSKDKETFKDLT